MNILFSVFNTKDNIIKTSISIFTPAEVKTQCFLHLGFNSTLLLINGISIDCQKLLRYFNGAAGVASFRIELIQFETVLSNNLVLYPNDLKTLLFAISALKLFASFL